MKHIEAIEQPAKISDKTAYILQTGNARNLAALRATLGKNQEDCLITRDLPLIDGIAVELADNSSKFLKQLKAMGVKITKDQAVSVPETKEMQKGREVYPTKLDIAHRTLNLDQLHEKGITGQGVTVAVIDSGIAPHPDLKDRIVGFFDLVHQKTEAYDDNKHGTHVSGIIAGNGANSDGLYMGAAPQAKLVGIKVLDAEGMGSTSAIIEGIQTAIEHKDELGIKVINLSLGSFPQFPLKDDLKVQAVNKAIEAGITVVCAVGNSGPKPHSIGSPANSPYVISVGAADDKNTVERGDDQIAYFTSRGPTKFDELPKPDVVAPGLNIISASKDETGYLSMSGTSMASPIVAGSVALLYQVKPDLNPKEIKELLMDTAIPLPPPKLSPLAQGKGMIDPLKAVEKIRENQESTKSRKN